MTTFTLTSTITKSEEFEQYRELDIQVQASPTSIFDGAVLRCEVQQENIGYTPLTKSDFSMTASDIFLLTMRIGSKYRFYVENSTATTNIIVSVL